MGMNVVIASRNWPPDIGGPASHAPDLGEFLHSRGHAVRAVVTAGRQGPSPAPFPLRASRRDRPRAIRLPASTIDVTAAARGADVVYATGMYTRAALATGLHRLPLAIKLVNDPAYERSRRLGLFSGSVEQFQAPQRHPAIAALKRLRRTMLSRADSLIVPSRFLAEIAASWGLGVDRIAVVPNPAPESPAPVSRAQLRRRLGIEGPTIAFVGRLARQKDVPLALAALERVPAVRMVVVGDGPERERIEDIVAQRGLAERVSLRGALPRAEALEWVRASDAALLSSAWENFPHAAVEAISVGTPVVATAVGGVPEIVQDGVNGLVVAPGDAEGMATAIAALYDDGLLRRLRETTAPSAARFERQSVLGSIEAELLALAGSGR